MATLDCQVCDGYGNVVSEASIRRGHTHSNDPDTESIPCEACSGLGTYEACDECGDDAEVTYSHGIYCHSCDPEREPPEPDYDGISAREAHERSWDEHQEAHRR